MTLARIRRVPTTDVVTFQSGQTVRQQISHKPNQPYSAVRLTAEDVADPSRLSRALSDLQTNVTQAIECARDNPLNAGGVHFRNKAVTGGTAFLLTHNMGRPFVGYIVTRVQGSNQITVRETALPLGLTSSQAVNLVPSASGTIDVLVI